MERSYYSCVCTCRRKCALEKDESKSELYVNPRSKLGPASGPNPSPRAPACASFAADGVEFELLAGHVYRARNGNSHIGRDKRDDQLCDGLTAYSSPFLQFYVFKYCDPDQAVVHGHWGKEKRILLRSSTGELNAISSSSFRVAVDTFMGILPSWSCSNSYLPSA